MYVCATAPLNLRHWKICGAVARQYLYDLIDFAPLAAPLPLRHWLYISQGRSGAHQGNKCAQTIRKRTRTNFDKD